MAAKSLSKCVLVAIVVSAFCFCQAEIPSFIRICHQKSPNVSGCISDSINHLRDKLKTGIPELNVPPFEPLRLKDIQLKRGPQSAQIDANITDLLNYGVSDFEILELKANIPKNRFRFTVLLPHLYFVGNYRMDMQILFFKLRGEGPITGNITNYHFQAELQGNKIVQEDGKEYVKFEKMKLSVKVGKVHYHLGNLFNGDPVLGDATNAVINDNSELIFNEIRPYIEDSVSDSCTDIANKISLSFPYEELFPL